MTPSPDEDAHIGAAAAKFPTQVASADSFGQVM